MDAMNSPLIDRRQFTSRCAAFGFTLPTVAGMLATPAGAQAPAAGEPAQPAVHTVKFPDGTKVAAIGQGSWHLGQGRHPEHVEQEALRTGIALGMTVIDTSENYGDGHSEEFIGRAIAGQRERAFLVTKVEPENIGGDGITHACNGSLGRLRTDHLDLYLLHAPVPDSRLAGVVAKFESLRAAGKIRAWGVSNFNVAQMEELFRVPDGPRCATNQVLYNLKNRAIEKDLLPWCQQHNMPVMAYSPLGGLNNALVRDPALAKVGAAHGYSAAAVALAWVVRSGNVIAIPESGSPAHVKENAAALTIW
jgi:diketogulonate reductase-like aldo/keto reductase